MISIKGLTETLDFCNATIEDDEAKGNQEKLYGAPEGMIVNPNSENVDVAVDFVKFLTSVEVSRRLYQKQGIQVVQLEHIQKKIRFLS